MDIKKTTGLFLSLAIVMAVTAGCTERKKEGREKTQIEPKEEIPGITEAVGTVGDGTSMNVLELIKADGDTLSIEIPINTITGGAESGDEIDIIYSTASDGDLKASVAINLTALQHLWTQSDGKGGEQSLEINPGGRASTYHMTIEYDSWQLKDGMLLLHSPKKVGEEVGEIVDTFHIMQLTEENLVLMNHDLESVFRRGN